MLFNKMTELKRVNPSAVPPNSEAFKVSFSASLAEGALHLAFKVRSPAGARANAALSGDHWGLWEHDVVEVFLTDAAKRAPYYEFVVSPLGQVFQLRIHEPRKKFDRGFRCEGLASGARLEPGEGWQAWLRVPLALFPRLPDDPRALQGNAFAILGDRPRQFFSLFTPPQATPDFHIPSHFRPILG